MYPLCCLRKVFPRFCWAIGNLPHLECNYKSQTETLEVGTLQTLLTALPAMTGVRKSGGLNDRKSGPAQLRGLLTRFALLHCPSDPFGDLVQGVRELSRKCFRLTLESAWAASPAALSAMGIGGKSTVRADQTAAPSKQTVGFQVAGASGPVGNESRPSPATNHASGNRADLSVRNPALRLLVEAVPRWP